MKTKEKTFIGKRIKINNKTFMTLSELYLIVKDILFECKVNDEFKNKKELLFILNKIFKDRFNDEFKNNNEFIYLVVSEKLKEIRTDYFYFTLENKSYKNHFDRDVNIEEDDYSLCFNYGVFDTYKCHILSLKEDLLNKYTIFEDIKDNF